MLTDTKIRKEKKPQKIADGGGLYLQIQPTGSKLWRQAYRWHGKQRTAALGSYPAVSLAEARAKREDLKRILREGRDPAAVRVAEKAEEAAERAIAERTFSVVATEWWDVKIVGEGRALSTLRHLKWTKDALNADIGHRPITELEPPELLKCLRKAAAKGTHEKVARMRSLASSVFRFGIAAGYCVRDPAADLKGALTSVESKPHPAVTQPVEIGKLIRTLDTVSPALVQLALKLLSLTAARPGELLSAEWTEIQNDLWIIPALKTKMRREHRVPLSRQAIALLGELRSLTGKRRHLFASHQARDQSINQSTLNRALVRAGVSTDTHVPHGFRSTFSTTANEPGLWSEDAVEIQLAHVDKNTVRRAYNRGDKWAERVALMQWWADQLDGMRNKV